MIMILAAGRIRLPQASGQGRKTVAIGQRVNFLPCLAPVSLYTSDAADE